MMGRHPDAEKASRRPRAMAENLQGLTDCDIKISPRLFLLFIQCIIIIDDDTSSLGLLLPGVSQCPL